MNCRADIAIIGGGAAGLAAAITAKKNAPFAEVCIYEALDRVGKKLITTGNGRCNITNSDIAQNRYHGDDVSFAFSVFEKNPNSEISAFFEEVGIPLTYEENKAYPASFQASSVVDCLRFKCDELGVKTVCGCKITDVEFGKNQFILTADEQKLYAKSVICCTGLYSGGEKLGSNGVFFRLLKEKGFKTVRLSPAIVQLKTETELVKQLKGIKVNAEVSLYCENKKLETVFGEVLFCDYGLSGPAVMHLSREAARNDASYSISLDLLPSCDKNTLKNELLKRKELLINRKIEDFFTGMLNKRLGQVILKYCGLPLSKGVSSIDKAAIDNIASAVKDFRFKVTGNTGFINSQVTAGGISTSEFSDRNLMSKRYRGLFACGELLDIDGDCGGFNLAWAWISGIRAGKSAAEYVGVKK